MSLILSIILLILCIQLCKNYKQGFINSFLLSILIIPKNAYIIGGLKFNIVVLVLLTLFTLKYKKKVITFKNPLLFTSIFYFFYTFIIAFFSEDLSLANQTSFLIKKWIEMFWFGLLVWNNLTDTKDYNIFINKLYKCILFLTIYGLIEFFTKTNLYIELFAKSFPDTILDAKMFLYEQRGILTGRIRGTTEHPLTWGQRCATIFMFLFFFRNKFSKKRIIIIESLLFINIVLTGSRSAIVPIVLFLLISLFSYYRKHLKKLITISAFLLIGGIIISPTIRDNETIKTIQAFVFFWDEEKSKEAEIKGSSVSLRIEQLEEALYAIDKKFYYGFGYGYVTNMDEDHYLREFLLGFESVALKVLVEQGSIGFMLYLVLFLLILKSCQRCTRNLSLPFNNNLFSAYILSYLISLLLTGERSSFQLFFLFIVFTIRYCYSINNKQN